MSNPFFSIIIPCYNSSSYVEEAILSVVNQSFQQFELLLIDDGSTDNTLAILKKYEGKGAIQVLSKTNGGYPSAINAGLKIASGEYVLSLGSDDRLMADTLGHIFSACHESKPDIIFFRSVVFHQGKRQGVDPLTDFVQKIDAANITFNQLNAAFPAYSKILYQRDTSRCFKRSKIGKNVYFGKTGIDGDAVFSLIIERQSNHFVFLPIDGYHWTQRDKSVSGRPQTYHTVRDRLYCWSLYFRFLIKRNVVITEQEAAIARRIPFFLKMLFDLRGCTVITCFILFKMSRLLKKLSRISEFNVAEDAMVIRPRAWLFQKVLITVKHIRK